MLEVDFLPFPCSNDSQLKKNKNKKRFVFIIKTKKKKQQQKELLMTLYLIEGTTVYILFHISGHLTWILFSSFLVISEAF